MEGRTPSRSRLGRALEEHEAIGGLDREHVRLRRLVHARSIEVVQRAQEGRIFALCCARLISQLFSG